ncbi:hypothetical protein N9L68_05155 [bacterium]|nr:hypothetical protein [bacterium]
MWIIDASGMPQSLRHSTGFAQKCVSVAALYGLRPETTGSAQGQHRADVRAIVSDKKDCRRKPPCCEEDRQQKQMCSWREATVLTSAGSSRIQAPWHSCVATSGQTTKSHVQRAGNNSFDQSWKHPYAGTAALVCGY